MVAVQEMAGLGKADVTRVPMPEVYYASRRRNHSFGLGL